MKNRNNAKKWADIKRKVYTDVNFKDKFMASPNQVLKEHGIDIGPDVQITVVENTSKHRYIVLFPPDELSETEMKHLDAGTSTLSSCTFDCSCG